MSAGHAITGGNPRFSLKVIDQFATDPVSKPAESQTSNLQLPAVDSPANAAAIDPPSGE